MKRASLLLAVLACHSSGPDRATPAAACFLAPTANVDGATQRPPGRFAALGPVCGGIGPLPGFPSIRVDAIPAAAADPYAYVATHLASTPVWLFHGAADRTVPPTDSRGLAEALRRAGAPARYTEYPGVGHNSWESAYNESELWRWLFSQRASPRQQPHGE